MKKKWYLFFYNRLHSVFLASLLQHIFYFAMHLLYWLKKIGVKPDVLSITQEEAREKVTQLSPPPDWDIKEAVSHSVCPITSCDLFHHCPGL